MRTKRATRRSLRSATAAASAVTPSDESRCAQEPIHIPGTIQPHGLLIVLAESNLSITHVSANIHDICGISARSARGARIAAIVGVRNADRIEAALRSGDLLGFNPMKIELEAGGATREFECITHRTQSSFIVELQAFVTPNDGLELDFSRIRRPLGRLERAPDEASLLRDAAGVVQRLSGFDRTMIYRFHDDWHGEVVAESTSGPDVPGKYLGLHFPASDIPEQARRLYLANPVRLIADVHYSPTALVPQPDDAGKPVDLSGAILRSVSPIHLEYLKNMGVRASMSISIIIAGRLWGLIACHHGQPRWIDYNSRDACVLVGDTLARQLQMRTEAANDRSKLHAGVEIEALSAQLFAGDDVAAQTDLIGPPLLTLFDAQGLVLRAGDTVTHVGVTPRGDTVARIVTALQSRINGGVAETHSLAPLVPEVAAEVSGALLIMLSGNAQDYLLLTRTELLQTVNWGGDVRKRVSERDDQLHPRESFDVWSETVRGRSRPWSANDIANAQRLKHKLGEHWVEAQRRRDTEELRRSAEALRQSVDALQRSERALRKSEAFLDRTGSVAGVGGWEVDLITGELYWSDHTCLIHGVTPGYRPTFDEAVAFYAPEAQPMIRSAIERGIAFGEAFDVELPLIRSEGRRIWVRAVGSPESTDGKAVRFTGAFQDVTDRVMARLALQEANERIQVATRSGGIGIYEWDLTTTEFTWDTTLCGLYGFEPARGAPSLEQWRLLVHPEDLASVEAAAQTAIESRKPLETEFRIFWPNGSVRHLRTAGHITFDARGRPMRFVGAQWDVTDQRRLIAAIAHQHELLRVTMQSIGDGVITTDARGQVTWLNPVAEHMTGWSAQEAMEQPIASVLNIINEETREPVESPVTACLAHRTMVGLANHSLLVSRAGGEAPIEDSAAPIRNELGELLGAVLVFHDVTEQRRLSGEASHRAAHDTLTGLPNRATFNDLLDRSISAADRSGTILAVLFVDLNKFKAINDTFGHTAGDRVLQMAAERLKACVRSDDFVARLGGDEFVIISTKLLDERDSEVIAGNLIAAFAEPIDLPDLPRLQIGLSIGIALYPTDARDGEAILQHADLAMYRSKKLGRSGFTRFGANKRDAGGDVPALERRIVRGLDRQEFVPYYQPIVDLRTGTLTGIEALARWNHPRLGVLSPDQFVTVAEDSGSIFRLGEVMLRSAILHTARWRAMSSPDLSVSVNVSPRQLGDDRFMHTIHDLFSATGASPDSLRIELTENALFENKERAIRTLLELSDLGIQIAIDDFGTGYSSLSRLQRLPVHMLKIDKSFVREIAQPGNARAIVRAIIAMAHSLGILVVAEGVESPAQLDVLASEGCDAAQGYLISEPLNHVDATTFITRVDVPNSVRKRSTVRNVDAR